MNGKAQKQSMRMILLIIACASLLISFISTPVSAAASPVGTWNVGGNLTISAKFPQVILSTTTLNAKSLGMTITYGDDGSFNSTLLGLSGTWQQAGSKVNLDLTSWLDGIKSTVASLLPDGTVVDVSKAVFTARVVSAKKMTGNVKVIVNATIPAGTELGGVPIHNQVNGRVMISGALTNSPAAAESVASMFGFNAVTGGAQPVDVLNRIIGSAFLYQLIAK